MHLTGCLGSMALPVFLWSVDSELERLDRDGSIAVPEVTCARAEHIFDRASLTTRFRVNPEL